MKNWKVILATLVIFGTGVLSGSLGTQLLRKPAEPPKPPFGPGGPGPERFDFIRRWGDRLDLTAEQRDKIDRLVRESQERVRALWEPVGPKIQEETRAVRAKIEEILTPEQRAKFAEMSKDRFRRGGPTPGAPPGELPPWRRREGPGRPAEMHGPGGLPSGETPPPGGPPRDSRRGEPPPPDAPSVPPEKAPARPER